MLLTAQPSFQSHQILLSVPVIGILWEPAKVDSQSVCQIGMAYFSYRRMISNATHALSWTRTSIHSEAE